MKPSWWLVVLLAGGVAAEPARVYVSPNGDDAAAGSELAPFRTVSRAQQAARALRAAQTPPAPIEVILRGGVHRLAAPLRFTPLDNGSPGAPTVYRSDPGERAVLSGGRVITGWRDEGDGSWSAPSGEVYFHELYVNGRRAQRARIPNTGYLRTAGLVSPIPKDQNTAEYRSPDLRNRLRYRDGDLKKWPDLGNMHVRLYHAWTASCHWVADIDEQARMVHLTAPTGWPVGYWEAEQRYVVENVRAGFDQPGEWYLNRAESRLYYRPLPGEDLGRLEVVAPVLGQLVVLTGDAPLGLWVEHLEFRGLGFEHAGWVMPPDRSHDGQACVHDGRGALDGAFDTADARACLIEGCDFAHIGPYAIRLGRGSREIVVRQCELRDLGCGGVAIGLPGNEPNPDLACGHNLVENCFIHDGGHVAPAGIGVLILRSSHNTVRRNEVCDLYYSGLSVGWDWGFSPTSAHHNLLEYNHLHHLGNGVLSDLGGIYTLGISPGTVLRGNLIHDIQHYSYGGWGIYNDASSSEITMERNVVYDTKSESYHLGNGRDNVLRDNLFADAEEAMIYRSQNLGKQLDQPSFTIAKNVVVSRTGWMFGGRWSDGGFILRDNLYFSRGAEPTFDGMSLSFWQAQGHDAGSRVADPKLVRDAQGRPHATQTALLREMGLNLLDDYGQVGLYGPAEWVARPSRIRHRANDPEMKPAKTYRPPKLSVTDDFEQTAVGDPPNADGGDLKLLAVTDETAGQGRRSVRLVDSPDHPQPWQPHLYYYPAWQRTATAQGAFRLRLGPGAVITHEWRDWSRQPLLAGPLVRFENGEAKVGGQTVARFPMDQWFEVELRCGLGDRATGTFQLTLRVEGRPDQVVPDLPVTAEAWRKCTWIGWISYAPAAATAWLDDLRFRLE